LGAFWRLGFEAYLVFGVWNLVFALMLIFDQLNKADRHLRMLSWIIAVGVVILLGGLWWVQIVRSRQFVESQFTQSYRTVRVPAPRGKIMDRNGTVLAENKPVYSITLYLEDRSLRDAVQKQFGQSKDAARRAAATVRKPNFIERVLSVFGYKPSLVQVHALSRTNATELLRAARFTVVSNIVGQLSEMIGERIPLNEAQLTNHYHHRLVLPFPIKTKLDAKQIACVQERGLNLPGIDMDVQPERVYPQRTLAAHVIGSLVRSDEAVEGDLAFFDYKLPDYRGYSGIEASFDSALRGRAGAKSVLVNNLGYRQTDTTLSPVEAGKDLTLTIDANIQRVAEHALANINGVTPPVRGGAVVLDVRSGEVLALASVPTFDPTDWIPYLPNAVAGLYTNEYLAPLRNRAIYGNYAPGSTFKIMVALAGLEAGTLKTNEIIRVEANPRDPAHGIIYVGKSKHSIRDTVAPGDYDFLRAFIKSSNSYFVDQGLRVRPEPIVAVAQEFHFGQRTGIPLADSPGRLPTSEWVRSNRGGWSPAAIGNLSIGQGDLDVTPLQLAVAVAAVANGGKVLKPQIVMNVRGPDELVAPNQPPALRPIVQHEVQVSARSMDIVRQAMLADVENPIGSGHGAFLSDFRACGKTGTAQVQRGFKMDYYTWFASYAPVEDPRYSVVVMVESGSSGGGTCAPVAKQIYEKLKYLPRASGNSVAGNFRQN
jgi:penicillin-binding protein 2